MKHNFLETDAECGSDYLLVCSAKSFDINQGTWHFSLESVDGSSVLEASDEELGDLNRLTLLAAVRGLEAIDGPSAVTMLSHSRYLIRSLSDSLPRWRENDFVWEHFGRRIDVQHADLWRRVDSALAIHRVEACLVSSRLVSRGEQASTVRFPGSIQETTRPDDGVTWRLDGAHAAGGVGGLPSTSDRLRHWLTRGRSESSEQPATRRFTAADLMETA